MLSTKKIGVLTSLLFVLTVVFVPKIFAESADHVLISHLQIAGNNADDEYLKLYNPTGSAVDLTGWKLTKKTSTGGEQNLKTDFDMNLDPGQYLLIAHSSDNYSGVETPDTFYSAQSRNISFDNSVILYDSEDNIVDKLGIGEAVDYEGSPATNLDPFQVLVRDPVNEDTDNNLNDFTLSIEVTPTPSPSATPTPTPESTHTPSPTLVPTSTPNPTPTISPTPLPTLTPTPTSTPLPYDRVIARFNSPLRTTTCYLRYQIIKTGFGQIVFPRIECQRIWH